MNFTVRLRTEFSVLLSCAVFFAAPVFADNRSSFLKICENPNKDERVTIEQIANNVRLKYKPNICSSIYRKIQKKKKFNYAGDTIKTLSPLYYLDRLESIRTMIDEDVTEIDFSGIQNLTNLKLLSLQGTNTTAYKTNTYPEIKGLESLSSLGELKSLTLNDIGINKIDFLGALNKIEQVTINKNKIDNLESKFLPSALITLNLRENFIPLIPNMAHLTSLQNLDLSHNTFNDISNLSGLDSLKDFRISRASSSKDRIKLDGLNVINTFSKLEILYIQGWNIENVDFLSGLEKIQEINLRNNKIIDVTPLNTLTSLGSLDVMRNNITDLSPLLPLSENPNFELSGNPNPLKFCSPTNARQLRAGISCEGNFFSDIWNAGHRIYERRQHLKQYETP